jgi:hypothetical protein
MVLRISHPFLSDKTVLPLPHPGLSDGVDWMVLLLSHPGLSDKTDLPLPHPGLSDGGGWEGVRFGLYLSRVFTKPNSSLLS